MISGNLVSASAAVTNMSIETIGDLSIEEIADNIVIEVITTAGEFNVTGNSNISGTSQEVCLVGEANCPNFSSSQLNDNQYLENNSGILDVNITIINATLDSYNNTTYTSLSNLTDGKGYVNSIGLKLYNETDELNSINTTANMKDLGFNTTTELDSKYITQSDEASLNVNLSDTTTSLITLSSLPTSATTITDTSITTPGNLTLGEKITFALGEIIDNIVDSWIRITGNLNVTGNATITGTSFRVNNQEVCLADGTNCQSSSGSQWNIASSQYLYNNSGILDVNETQLNATIDARDSDTTYSHLSNFTDDLGNRGYTSLSNFTNDLGYVNSTDLQNYNETDKINSVNTTANIKGLGFNITTELDSKYIAQLEEGNLNVNSSTWWNTVSGWVGSWFYNSGNNLAFNETKLNATIDARASNDGQGINASETKYLYDDGVTVGFNETQLNSTIDARDSDTTYSHLSNFTDDLGNRGYNSLSNFTNDLDFVNSSSLAIYNDTTLINAVNTTANIEGLGFVTGAHTVDTDTQKSASGYLYNDSTTVYLNETQLNATIDARDLDTTYSNGSGISLTGTEFNHSDTSSQASSDNSGRTYIQDLTLDEFGHLTGLTTATETVADTQKSAGGNYLYNDSASIYLNETELNATIDARDSDTTYAFECSTGQFVKNLTSSGGYTCDTPAGGSGYISLYSSGNFNGSLYTTGADPTASDSNSIFQILGSSGFPQFQIQNGGSGQASFVARSFLVVNENTTHLNQSQNNLCSEWGFSYIDCNTSTTGADMGVQDDLEVQGLAYYREGIYAETSDWGVYAFMGDLMNVGVSGSNGTFTDNNNYFCDYVLNPFLQAHEDDENWLKIKSGVYEGAIAEVSVLVNSSCIKLSNNPAWSSDLTNQRYELIHKPVFVVSDGGAGTFYVGNSSESRFEVEILDGSGFYGMHLEDTAGADQHKAFVVDVDVKNNTGVVGQNIFVTSSGGSFLDIVGMLLEVNPINLDNSDYSHMEFHNLAPLTTNDLRIMDIFGSYTELIRHESIEILDYVGYYNGATLTNITANATSSSTNMEIFSNDDDEIYFCDSNNLTELAINLQTDASAGLNLNYYYYASDGTWKPLPTADTTTGFTRSGSIRWATPSDINLTTTDRHANSIGAPYYCIALQRTRNNIVTPPVESLFSASGSVQFLLRDDLIKLTPVSAPPLACDSLNDGAIYYDSDVQFHCSCKAGTGWVQMNDYSTACS